MPPFVGQVGWMNPITGIEGELTIDQIKSGNYLPGATGWIIQKDGAAEFNDVDIRGSLQSTNYVAGVSGWRLLNTGSAELNSVTARGEFDIVNGNAQIVIKNDSVFLPGFPGMFLYPDTTTFDFGVVVAGVLSADTAYTEISSPQDLTDAGAHSADLFLNSGTTAKKSLATINADNFEVFGGFAYQGLASSQVIAASSALVTPGNTTTVTSITIGATAGCTYEINAAWSALLIGTPVAFPGNRANVLIKRNGTQIASISVRGQNSTIGQDGGSLYITDTPGAGNATYDLVLSHDVASTAANYQMQASATAPIVLSVKGFKANI
jgi:hypothetical protein